MLFIIFLSSTGPRVNNTCLWVIQGRKGIVFNVVSLSSTGSQVSNHFLQVTPGKRFVVVDIFVIVVVMLLLCFFLSAGSKVSVYFFQVDQEER